MPGFALPNFQPSRFRPLSGGGGGVSNPDVFVLAGQSNMVGQATFDGGATHPAGTKMLNQAGEIVDATNNLDHISDNTGLMGLSINFAIDHLATTGRNCLFVPMGENGSGFNNLKWVSPNGTALTATLSQLTTLDGLVTNMQVAGFLWLQGTTDAADSATYLNDDFLPMLDYLRANGAGMSASTPFVVGGLLPGDANRDALTLVLQDVPNVRPYTAFASSTGATGIVGDPVHFDAPSLRVAGSRFEDAFVVAQSAAADIPEQVTNLIASPGDTEVTLTWDKPASNGSITTDYLIEVNINGAGYVTVSDGTNANLTYTHTGLTNDLEHVYRVSAINAEGTGAASAESSATPVAGADPYIIGGHSPQAVADFEQEYYRKGGSDSTFSGVLSFSRTGSAWYRNSSGVWTEATSGNSRTGHHVWNGSSWVNGGVLVERAATNLLHSTDALTTQTETVTAQSYTLHFTGTGSVDLSGAHTATLSGTAAGEENRVSLTFTPSAGTLTLTVTGTVTNAQLETGALQTSYTPNTAGSGSVTRNAETLEISAANTSLSTTAFSTQIDGFMSYVDDGLAKPVYDLFVTVVDYHCVSVATAAVRSGEPTFTVEVSNALDQVTGSASYLSPGVDQAFSLSTRQTTTDMTLSYGGTAVTASATGAITDFDSTDIRLGQSQSAFFNVTGSVTISKFILWEDVGLTNSELESANGL